MIANTLIRTTSRRLSSSAATTNGTKKVLFSSSSARQAFFTNGASSSSTEHELRKKMILAAAATTICGWSIAVSRENEDTNAATQCLVAKKSDVALAKEQVENKFATYWPRNIMILFGPPGAYYHTIRLVCTCG